jgi:crotonobetaine/carnitine-CoA ligase
MNAADLARRTLPAMLADAAARHDGRAFVRIAGAAWCHADAPGVAAAAGAALRALGAEAGDRVALLCGNRAECIAAWLGCG